MMPPTLREELARSDAERQAIREKRADYWHRVSADLLKLLRNFDEEDSDPMYWDNFAGGWTMLARTGRCSKRYMAGNLTRARPTGFTRHIPAY